MTENSGKYDDGDDKKDGIRGDDFEKKDDNGAEDETGDSNLKSVDCCHRHVALNSSTTETP